MRANLPAVSGIEDASKTRIVLYQSGRLVHSASIPALVGAADTLRDYLNVPPYVSTLTALKALDYDKDTSALVTEPYRGGFFTWDGGDHSASGLVSRPGGTTTVVNSGTDTCTLVAHKFLTGAAVCVTAAVNGLSTETIYYIIKVDADNFRLASSFANAFAGTAFNLTGTTNFTLRRLMDPLQAVFIIPTGLSITGSQGAWKRYEYTQYLDLHAEWYGALGDAVTDCTQAFYYMLDLCEKHQTPSRFGGICHFGKGTFKLSQTLRIGNATILRGKGMHVSTLWPIGVTTGHCFELGPDNVVDTSGNSVFGYFGTYGFGMRLEDLDIKGGNLDRGLDAALVYTPAAHQPSGVFRCFVREIVNIGVHFGGGAGGPANFYIENCDIEAGTTNPASGDKTGIRFSGGGVVARLDTVNIQGGASTLAVGLDMEKDHLVASGLHLENSTVGVLIRQNEPTRRGNSIKGITGSAAVPTLIKRNSGGFHSLVVENAFNGSIAVSGLIVIDDQETGFSIQDTTLSFYDSDNPDDFYIAVGDADSAFTPLKSGHLHYTAPLTANRTVTLDTTGAVKGRTRLRVVRAAASTGAFTVSVGGLASLTPGTWAEVMFNGTAYVLMASGYTSFSTAAFTSGTINGTTIGATTPSTGAFTTLSASGLITATGGQIAFPATQVPSANVNTLDDYEEGTFTPVLTFATPGNLAVAYTTQAGSYVKIGKQVTIWVRIQTSTFTHTTASGSLTITGLPFTVANTGIIGTLAWQGITKANYTDMSFQGSGTTLLVSASGSGQARAIIAPADMPTGGTVQLFGSLSYEV